MLKSGNSLNPFLSKNVTFMLRKKIWKDIDIKILLNSKNLAY